MFPTKTANNMPYSSWTNTILACQRSNCFAISMALPNRNNIACNKFTTVFIAAFWWIRSPFVGFVSMIFGKCPQKEMIWVNAYRIVAFVANIQSIRYRTVMNLITEAMRGDALSININFSIAITFLGCLPFPAITRITDRDFFPETSCWGLGSSASILVTIDKFTRFTFLQSVAYAIVLNNISLFSASAMAVSIGDFLRGCFCGMIGHVISSFQLVNVPGMLSHRPAFVLDFLV